ncbi:MAG TPA: M50 family metallopeptidase [Candidatus Saccharimonadales bacterium]|nr:M50 family metallopeptidase [Candidatus Saccharimonadales bacterium]
MSVVLLILGLLLFVGLVVLHEFGHFIAARRNGVEVEEFGIGFPPRAWSRKTKRGFVFSLNWLPIGGFVKLKGENDSATEKGSFGAASFSTKTKIMLAGVGMNLLAAFAIFTALAWIGMPQILDNQFSVKSDTKVVQRELLVGYVEPGSPADKGGLEPRDKLFGFIDASSSFKQLGPDGREVLTPFGSAAQLPSITKAHAGKPLTIVYERGGERREANVVLRSHEEAKGSAYLGMSPAEFTITRATWSAPVQSVGLIGQITAATFKGLGTAISALFQGDTAKASEQVSGPVGIVVALKDGSLLGLQFVLLIIGIISLSLAIMNVLPIPALDGGRFYVMLLSRLFGKRLSQDMEERIVGSSFIFLLILIVLITIVDVRRFF